MASEIKPVPSESQLMGFLQSTYDKVIDNLPVVGSAVELAESYRNPNKHVHACVDSLIHWQSGKAATSGFITGLGGFLTMPLAIPADFAQSVYVQLRMVAAIGHLYGHDVHSDGVKIMAIACLCGGSVTEVLSKAGVKIGQHVSKTFIKSISGEMIKAINKQVGFRLLTKFGTKGTVNLGKLVPFFGAAVGSTLNYIGTYSVGKAAKKLLGGDMDTQDALVVNVSSSIPMGYEEKDIIAIEGPRIYGLQLGMTRVHAQTELKKLSVKTNLLYEPDPEKDRVISANQGEVFAEVEYNDDNNLKSYKLTPRIFKARNFFDEKFIAKFIDFYQLPELSPEIENEKGRYIYMDEENNWEILLEEKSLVVKRTDSDEPVFE